MSEEDKGKLNDTIENTDDYEQTYETIIIEDEDGEEIEFIVMDGAELGGINYLLVISSEDIANDEAEAYFIKEVPGDADESAVEFVYDDEELNRVSQLFAGHEDLYEIEAWDE